MEKFGQQPSNQQFENDIAMTLFPFSDNIVFVEDESRLIGKCKIPDMLFAQMRLASLFYMERPFQERVDILYSNYHTRDKTELIDSTKRLQKHLGTETTNQIINLIKENHQKEAIKFGFKVL